MGQTRVADSLKNKKKFYVEPESKSVAADPIIKYLDESKLETLIKDTRKKMEFAAKDLDFLEAARYRDELYELEDFKEKKKNKSHEK
jgi:excinuclease ABC subunit B